MTCCQWGFEGYGPGLDIVHSLTGDEGMLRDQGSCDNASADCRACDRAVRVYRRVGGA